MLLFSKGATYRRTRRCSGANNTRALGSDSMPELRARSSLGSDRGEQSKAARKSSKPTPRWERPPCVTYVSR